MPEQTQDELQPDLNDVIQMRDAYQRCRETNATLRSELRAASEEMIEWRREMDWLGQRILGEAQERDWCSAYDEWVNEVNAQNSLCVLPVRASYMEATFTVTFSGQVLSSRNGDWEETLSTVLRDLRDHSDSDWIEDWEVGWNRHR